MLQENVGSQPPRCELSCREAADILGSTLETLAYISIKDNACWASLLAVEARVLSCVIVIVVQCVLESWLELLYTASTNECAVLVGYKG